LFPPAYGRSTAGSKLKYRRKKDDDMIKVDENYLMMIPPAAEQLK
jgi:hypothetical protein